MGIAVLADEGGQLLHHHSFDVCCTIALPLEWELQCWPINAAGYCTIIHSMSGSSAPVQGSGFLKQGQGRWEETGNMLGRR